MRRLLPVLAIVLSAAATAGALAAKPPPAPSTQLTLASSRATVTFGKTAVLTGQLTRQPAAGQTVELQQNPAPFKGYKPLATAVTDASGNYSFTVKPGVNTRYRVRTKQKPQLTSAEVTVNVAIKVTLRVSDPTPRRGQRVAFTGTAAPQHDGLRVAIERRTSAGYRLVARTTLLDAGDARSKYRRTLRIASGGLYRAKVNGDADHVTGTSPRRRVTLR